MEIEHWNSCIEDARYEVSNQGRVRRKANRRIRKPSNAGKGYCSIIVYTPDGYVGYYIHRLVANAFLGPAPEGQEVSHKNGNRKDNRLDNLIYESHKDNMSRRQAHATSYHGERNPAAKLTQAQVSSMRYDRKKGGKLLELATKYGVSFQQVSRICLEDNWKGGKQDVSKSIFYAKKLEEQK